jgi:hypothetical protein
VANTVQWRNAQMEPLYKAIEHFVQQMRAADFKGATAALDGHLLPELKKFARHKDVEELLEVAFDQGEDGGSIRPEQYELAVRGLFDAIHAYVFGGPETVHGDN